MKRSFMPVLPLIIVAAVVVVSVQHSTVALLLFPLSRGMKGLEDLFQDDENNSGVIVAANDAQIHGIDDLFDALQDPLPRFHASPHQGIELHQHSVMVLKFIIVACRRKGLCQ
jgi:hypothetical protein